jgi:hypothetical protein
MTKYGQPVISRETRLLLITIVISVGALWLLARPALPGSSGHGGAGRAGARAVARAVELRRSGAIDVRTPSRRLRHRRGDRSRCGGTSHRRRGRRRPRCLAPRAHAIARADVASLATWTPRIFDYPRYLVAVEIVEGSLSLRPVFVGSLVPVESRDWNGSIWRLPPGVGLSPGTFLFSTEGLLAGVAVEQAGALSLVPAPLVLESAKKLSRNTPHAPRRARDDRATDDGRIGSDVG